MRKQVFGRKFKRDKDERKALFNGLISAMVINGSIKTTEEKAKSIKADVEKLVTKAKKEQAAARRLLQSHLKPQEVEKMITEIAPRFKNRAGGYTRIIKTGRRFNDDASMVVMSWVEGEEVILPVKPAEKKEKTVKAPKSLKTKAKTSLKKEPHSAKASRGKKEKK